jgi:hypothetical protein
VFSSLKFQVPGSLTSCAPLCPFACQTQNTAPEGSENTAMRPASKTSNGSTSSFPPAAFTFSAVSSALSTQI